MSFLFGKKNKAGPGGKDMPAGGNLGTTSANGPREKDTGPGRITPGSSVNNSVNSVGGANTPSPEHNARNGSMDHEAPQYHRPGINGPAIAPAANPNLYPWSQRKLTFTSTQPNPFPRYGAAVNATSSKEGDIYVMGGLVNGSTVKGDLWMIEAGGGTLACYPIGTTSEGPNPRVGHASLLVGNAFIVFGGDTKQEDTDPLDDTLYLLNTSTRQWSRALPSGPRPAGRYGHTLNILGSKIYVFGGQVDGHFFNDLLAFDLNQLQNPANRWETLLKDSTDSEMDLVALGQVPLGRTNHSIVAFNDKLYLFGGTDGVTWLNDVWTYDPRGNEWTQLDCIGYIPMPREGHSAALVGDVMYVFGGRTEDGNDLGDLAAFRITSRRWYTFQNMGPSPSPRSGHSMTSYGKQIVVLAGEPSSEPSNPNELSLVYVLDTAKIRYPNDQQVQQTPIGERVPGSRRPSQGEKSGVPQSKAMMARDNSMGTPEKPMGKFGDAREGASSPSMVNGSPSANSVLKDMSPPPASGSRLPRAAGSQAPSGPPPQQQPPPPRANGQIPVAPGTRSRTPTGGSTGGRGFGPPLDTTRPSPYDRRELSPVTSEEQRGPGSRAMSPITNGRLPTATQSSTRPENSSESDSAPHASASLRSTIPQSRSQPSFPSASDAPNASMIAKAPSAQFASQQRALPNLGIDQPPSFKGPNRTEPASKQQLDELTKALEASKSRNAWLTTALELAQRSGEAGTSGSKGVQPIGDEHRSLVEALMAMRAGLAEVQRTVPTHVHDAAQKVVEIERQRDVAIREAAQARAKVGIHESSHTGTSQLGGGIGDSADSDHTADTSRKLGLALTQQAQLKAKLEALMTELSGEKKAREVAEDNAEAANLKLIALDQTRNPGETEKLRTELVEARRTARDATTQRSETLAQLRLLEVDHEAARHDLEETRSVSGTHIKVLGSLREAVHASTGKALVLEEKLDGEREQRESLQRKLLQLRTEHEEQSAELDTTQQRLRDTEDLAEQHANEAEKHREAVIAGLDKLSSRSPTETNHAATEKRVLILQSQVKDANSLVQRSHEDADLAAEKLRSAEERIAGLEAYQQQISRENLTVRNQLQDAVGAAQAFQNQQTELKQRLESHQRDANAMVIQHGVLKDMLGDRAGSAEAEADSAGHGHAVLLRELESKLDESRRAHDETKARFDAQEQESESVYREKLEQLEQDYQSAVSYVKGTEKMLKRMKDELGKSKSTNVRLQGELDRAQEHEARSIDEPSAEWDVERQGLRRELEDMQAHVKGSIFQLEQQIVAIREELTTAQADRDRYRASSEQLQQQFVHAAQQARADTDKLRQEKAFLEARTAEAEKKALSFLDQLESSVDSYRRRSQGGTGTAGTTPNGTPGPFLMATGSESSAGPSHTRNVSGVSTATSTGADSTYSVATSTNRDSQALDHLASELETLRTQWEGTHRSYRLSDQFDFDRTSSGGAAGGVGAGAGSGHSGGPGSGSESVSASGSGGGGEMSNSLASWRKRLDAEEKGKDGNGEAAAAGGKKSDVVSPLRRRADEGS